MTSGGSPLAPTSRRTPTHGRPSPSRSQRRVLRSGDLVRVGRVWLEIRIDPLLTANATPTSAKALALRLITQALATQGEDGSPRIMVTEGPDAGKSLDVHDVTRRYVVGRAPDVDLVLEDETAARRHWCGWCH